MKMKRDNSLERKQLYLLWSEMMSRRVRSIQCLIWSNFLFHLLQLLHFNWSRPRQESTVCLLRPTVDYLGGLLYVSACFFLLLLLLHVPVFFFLVSLISINGTISWMKAMRKISTVVRYAKSRFLIIRSFLRLPSFHFQFLWLDPPSTYWYSFRGNKWYSRKKFDKDYYNRLEIKRRD